MSERADAANASATGEAVGTAGLFLSIISLIAFSIGLGSLALGDVVLAVTAGLTALAAFAVSMACFVVESERSKIEVADTSLPMA